MTNYTKECPLCGFEGVEWLWLLRSNTYECAHCRSMWNTNEDGTKYELLQDNTESIDPRTIVRS